MSYAMTHARYVTLARRANIKWRVEGRLTREQCHIITVRLRDKVVLRPRPLVFVYPHQFQEIRRAQ